MLHMNLGRAAGRRCVDTMHLADPAHTHSQDHIVRKGNESDQGVQAMMHRRRSTPELFFSRRAMGGGIRSPWSMFRGEGCAGLGGEAACTEYWYHPNKIGH